MRLYISSLLAAFATILVAILASRYLHNFWYFSPFQSAQTHFGLLAAAIGLASFALHRSKPVLLLVVLALALAIWPAVRIQRLADMASVEEAAGKPRLRLMSFNILGDNYENGARIRDEILKSEADVAVVLEAPSIEAKLDALSQRYPYRIGCGALTQGCDLMVLSRLPLKNQRIDALSELRSERYIEASVEVQGRKVNVVAAHLSKAWFDDYHGYELWQLMQNLKQLEGPLVLAGDFNTSSMAADMGWFLRQSGMRRAPMEPATWPVEFGTFGIAIDHIFARAPMRLARLERLPDNLGSNHYGLIADLIIE